MLKIPIVLVIESCPVLLFTLNSHSEICLPLTLDICVFTKMVDPLITISIGYTNDDVIKIFFKSSIF